MPHHPLSLIITDLLPLTGGGSIMHNVEKKKHIIMRRNEDIEDMNFNYSVHDIAKRPTYLYLVLPSTKRHVTHHVR